METSIADPDPFDTDPDPAFHFDTDPDPALQFDADPTVGSGSESLLLKSENVPKTVLLSKVNSRNLSPQLRNIAENQINY